jgi:hypothetical protein
MARLVIAAVLGLAVVPTAVGAQPPAPRVTIHGVMDVVGSTSKNWVDLDVTNPRDALSYTRQRARFDVTGAIGRSRAVWGIELDFVNGSGITTQTGNTAGAMADLDTDVTCSGSLLPFVPVETIGRFGAQPARGHEDKSSIHFGGDFPGASLTTTYRPDLRSTLTWVQIAEALDRVGAPGQAESFAVLGSLEWDVAPGLVVKPRDSFVRFDGGNP